MADFNPEARLFRDAEHELITPFRRADLSLGKNPSRRISVSKFVNILNYHHFTQKPVFVLLRHSAVKKDFLIEVVPEPCRKDFVKCSFPEDAPIDLDVFEIRGLLVDDAEVITYMEVETVEASPRSFTARLRDKAFQYHARKAVREVCRGVDAIVTTPDSSVMGALEEIHLRAMRIRLCEGEEDAAARLDAKTFITVTLARGLKRIYSGSAKLVRIDKDAGIVVLEPVNTPAIRYMNRKIRNVRVRPEPAPRLRMTHPLSGKGVFYDIVDMTNSGLCVMERQDLNTLLPGMVIDDSTIIFPGGLELPAPLRVVYAKRCRGGRVRLGFAITDMKPADYTRMFNLITKADDPHSVATTRVSMEALWEFFFRSGFIYPDKYICISSYKEDFKRTYERLYHKGQDVFSNLTYQENNTIYGHVSILRAYPSTWMVHHLAAIPMRKKRTGLFVLQQILNYLDGLHRMPSSKMTYLIFYYRPENRFPNFFFGGVHDIIGDVTRCSIDHFAYLTMKLGADPGGLPMGWELRPCTHNDILDLHDAYHRHSKGFMTEVFCLDRPWEELSAAYERLGLQRQCSAYTLTHRGEHRAFFIVDRSDRGMNLSDLINSIKIIVTDTAPSVVPWGIIQAAVDVLGQAYAMPEVVVQVFPEAYLDAANVAYGKKYCLWALRARYLDPHLDDIKRMTSFSRLKYIKSRIKTMVGIKG